MPFYQYDSLRYFAFDLFQGFPVVQGMFSRQGGVSPAPWDSLNLGGTVGDERVNVIENRRRIFEAMGRKVESIYDSWQVHGTHVICTTCPRPLDGLHEKGDAILTDRPDVTLFMRFADCVPIFLYDPVREVIGIVHAGWRGTVERVISVTVERMREAYSSRPADILAGIGPSICADHYQVGPEVVAAAQAAFGAECDQILVQNNGSIHLDLWQANRLCLEQSGVRQIEVAQECTLEHADLWYSHRGEKGKTGRFGALLALKQG